MNNAPRFQAVIFDLDGTLVDHFTAIYRCLSYALEKIGAPRRSFAEVKRAVGGAHEATLRLFVTEEQYSEALCHYRECINGPSGLEGLRLLDGAVETLTDLRQKGVAMAVLTNKAGDVSRRLLRHLGIDMFFSVVVGFEDTPWRKPQPELTRFTLERLGYGTQQTLMVGDSPFDVATARAADLKICCVPTGTHTRVELENEHPDWLVDSLRDVVKVISGQL